MYCKYCGKKLNDGARFCPYCGKDQMPDNTENKRPVPGRKNPAIKTNKTVRESGTSVKVFLSKNSSLVAIIVVIVVAVVSIVGITRNLGNSSEWVVGTGETTASSKSSSKEKASYSDQIDKIMTNFEDYITETEEAMSAADADYEHHSHAELLDLETEEVDCGRVNAGYRMFELSCVISEELDDSGTYASGVAESAKERYQAMDATIEYGNIQEINALYRCAEMLGSIVYELGGAAAKEQINLTFQLIPEEEPDEYNFMTCRGYAMSTIFEFLYEISYMLDLPAENINTIRNYYDSWSGYMNTVESEADHITYNVGDRRFWGSLYYTSVLLGQLASGLDTSGQYSDDINEVVESISTYGGDHGGDYGSYWEVGLMEESTRLLAIVARLLA